MKSIYLILMMSGLLSCFNFFYLVASEGECEDVKHITGNDAYELTDTEKQSLIERAMTGDSDASYRLAKYYEMIKYDLNEAMKWLEKAAKAGHVRAQYSFAFHLADPNIPGRTSRQEAIYWYIQAAKQGDSTAMLNLAGEYETGKEEEQGNLIAAFEWYEKAALEGERSAILKMIEFYEEGKGIPLNNEKAYVWILIAENKIHPKSVIGQRIKVKKNEFMDKLSTIEVENAENEFELLSNKIKYDGWSINRDSNYSE